MGKNKYSKAKRIRWKRIRVKQYNGAYYFTLLLKQTWGRVRNRKLSAKSRSNTVLRLIVYAQDDINTLRKALWGRINKTCKRIFGEVRVTAKGTWDAAYNIGKGNTEKWTRNRKISYNLIWMIIRENEELCSRLYREEHTKGRIIRRRIFYTLSFFFSFYFPRILCTSANKVTMLRCFSKKVLMY